MAARRKGGKRIEPRFDVGGDDLHGDFTFSDDDRAAPKPRRKPAPVKGKAAGGGRRSGTARHRRGGLVGAARFLLYWSFIFGIWGAIGVTGIVAWYGARMPSAATWAVPDRPPNVKIVSVDGRMVGNRGATGGEAVGLHEMSPYIPQAVVAIEDRRFYSHFGVDPIGLARAMTSNLMAGRLVQGGSTLTQQLAKNLFLEPDRTLERKVQEVLLALWLEHKYSKDEILQMYLNRVYFGSGSYGVEAAARRYFGRGARDVSLQEAALLAGLLKAPSRLSPARDPQAAEERAQIVLSAMREQGMIGDGEMTAALTRPPTHAAAYWTGSENYVADAVMAELPELVGKITADLVVDTTIDLTLQKLAERSIRTLIAENGKAKRVSQGALVSIDGSGAVRAMVGGTDYASSQYDRAREAKRQPGSTFKPFVYLAALEKGATPSTTVVDKPVRFGKWAPENFEGKYYGEVTLETALSKSLNSVAAQLAMQVGPKTVAETARRLGIRSALQPNASIALGTAEVSLMELTAAYVQFANGGYGVRPHLIRRVTTASGKVLYENRYDGAKRVMGAQVNAWMNRMMSRTVAAGTARKARFDYPAAGKTGTTQNFGDAWFIGYTANLTTGVWFGNGDGKPMKKVTGGSLPAEAWRDFMVKAHEGVPVASLPGTAGDSLPTDIPVTDPEPDIADGMPAADADFPPAPQATDTAGLEEGEDAPGIPIPADPVRTGSTAPRPPAHVGGDIVDFVLGR